MFKLTVVNGPAKGTSYQLRDAGETSIGRVDGNDVVLTSQKVSKKHCVLVVSNTSVTVKDAGSSNGTFVNGILTKLKLIRPGDRVSVGEFVLELVKVDPPKPRAQSNNVLVMPGIGQAVGATGSSQTGGNLGQGMGNAAAAPPQNLIEKLKFAFEQNVINVVYNLNEKHEWHVMMAGMIALLVVAGAFVSVYPVLDRVEEKLTNEAAGRALLLARQMVDRNAGFIFDKNDSKIDIGYVEKEQGVIATYIVDMDQRILAPGRMLNQSISEAEQGVFASQAVKAFHENEAKERATKLYGNTVAAAVPLRIFSAGAGKNITVAIGLVFVDKSLTLFDQGTEAMAYIQAIILSAILAVLVFFALYRMTTKPLLYLNEQIDHVLKGNAHAVEKKFKMEEINPLIDIINSTLQRAAQAGPEVMTGSGLDDVLETLKFTASRMVGSGMMVFGADKRVLVWSPFIAEMTSISAETAMGQEVGSIARDASLQAFIDDLFARAPFAGAEAVVEDYEFSGTSYRLEVLATGSAGAVKYYVITAVNQA